MLAALPSGICVVSCMWGRGCGGKKGSQPTLEEGSSVIGCSGQGSDEDPSPGLDRKQSVSVPRTRPFLIGAGARGLQRCPHLLDALIHVFQEALVHTQAPKREDLVGWVTPQSQNCSPTFGVWLVCGRSWVPPFRFVDPGIQDVHLSGWDCLDLPLPQALGAPICSPELLDTSILSYHRSGLRPRPGIAAGQPCPCPHPRANCQPGPGDCCQPHVGIGGLWASGGRSQGQLLV